jgi:hypothetical protein
MKHTSVLDGRSRRDVLRIGALSAAALVLPGGYFGVSPSQAASGAGVSSGPLRSAGVLTFGPDNVLFVGDIAGAAVHAFALRDTDVTPQTDMELGNFHNFEGRDLIRGLDQKLAALFGTTYDQMVVNDMVVHQPSQQIFISVERGRGTNAAAAIVKVNNGNLEVLELDSIPHSQVAIPNEPDEKAMLEFEPQLTYAITDVKYHSGEIFVTGVSNQRFASTLYRIPYPFNAQMAACTVEIWHPVHGEFETRAPIIRHLIREVQGELYLFAVYGCTPLVRFPLNSLKDGAHVRGDTIGELGYPAARPIEVRAVIEDDVNERLLKHAYAAYNFRVGDAHHRGGQRICDLIFDDVRRLAGIVRRYDHLHVRQIGNRIKTDMNSSPNAGADEHCCQQQYHEAITNREFDNFGNHGYLPP